MTVAELIAKLQEMPQDAPVYAGRKLFGRVLNAQCSIAHGDTGASVVIVASSTSEYSDKTLVSASLIR